MDEYVGDGSLPIEWEKTHRNILDEEFFKLKEIMDIRYDNGGNDGIHKI